MDMRRTGAIEANAGGVSVESIAAKMGNSIDQNKTLQRTYMPVNLGCRQAADASRKDWAKKPGSKRNEFRVETRGREKLKLFPRQALSL